MFKATKQNYKMSNKFDNSSMKTIGEQSTSLQALLGTVMEFARRF
jgi:hypothetical protein